MQTYVIFNQKGGVGKSTVATNLAAVAANRGKKVLLVDLDAQANSTRYVLGENVESEKSIAEFFSQSLRVSLYPQNLFHWIHATPFNRLYVLPAHVVLDELHDKLSAKHKIYKLREALAALDFDEIWIDTPPVMNFYTLSAFIAADACLVPFDGDRFSLEAAIQVNNHIQEVRADHNNDIRLLGAVMNGYQVRAKSIQEGIDQLKAVMPVLEPYLPHSVVVKSSRLAAKPMVFFDASHKLTQSLEALLDSIHICNNKFKIRN